MGLLLQVNHLHLTFSDGLPYFAFLKKNKKQKTQNPFTWLKEKNQKPQTYYRLEKWKKFHFLIFQRCQTSRILMKLFQYDLLGLLKLKPMGTPQVIQFCVLISAQFNRVRETLPEKQTYVCDFKLNQNQDSATFSNAKGGERDDFLFVERGRRG